MSCACFGLCVPLPFMPSYVWAKWRQPIATNLSYQLITSLRLLMLLIMLFPSRSHSCITSTATTSPLFLWTYSVSLLFTPSNLCSISWNYKAILEAPFPLSLGFRLIDSIFEASLPLLLSVAVLTRHATKVIVFELELPLMPLRGECLTRRFVF